MASTVQYTTIKLHFDSFKDLIPFCRRDNSSVIQTKKPNIGVFLT
jgi:hypothetical protein